MDDENVKTLADYIDGARRHRKGMTITSSGLLVVSLLVAFLWPPSYKSSATILIESQDIPTDLVRTTVTSFAIERIGKIASRVLSGGVLFNMIDKYGLYADRKERDTKEEILVHMRDSIQIEPDIQDIVDPQTGRPSKSVIKFYLTYEGDDPGQVQKVTSDLTNLFLEQNLQSRTEQSELTFSFLTKEADRLKQEIAKREQEISSFKEKNANNLPELREMNLRLTERTEAEMADTEIQLRALRERKIALTGQLDSTDREGTTFNATGQAVMGSAARLKTLKIEYLTDSARYSEEHPDIKRIKREIEGLEAELGVSGDFRDQSKKLSELRAQYATASKTYSADHPDVVQLQKAIHAVEADMARVPGEPAKPKVAADNPAYISLQSQIDAVNSSISSFEAQKKASQQKLDDLDKRLMATPEVERVYTGMIREQQNDELRYREIKQKQMEAKVAKELEQEQKGERFELIDPPLLPEEPSKPNRPVILFLGLILSGMGGLGYLALQESLDTTVRGSRGILRVTGELPLASIPYIPTPGEHQTKARTKWGLIIGIGVAILIALLVIHNFVLPLDVLWYRLLRKVGM